ncbi:nickel insertion protein [Sphaerisporangium album]|uniref:nickel insertion protein n=1 Tax=Sphaerisporangium album TaxID=509200 RepID=UPI003CCC7574
MVCCPCPRRPRLPCSKGRGCAAGEAVTPTGAALLHAAGTEYGPPPEMELRATGYGAGFALDDGPCPAWASSWTTWPRRRSPPGSWNRGPGWSGSSPPSRT